MLSFLVTTNCVKNYIYVSCHVPISAQIQVLKKTFISNFMPMGSFIVYVIV